MKTYSALLDDHNMLIVAATPYEARAKAAGIWFKHQSIEFAVEHAIDIAIVDHDVAGVAMPPLVVDLVELLSR